MLSRSPVTLRARRRSIGVSPSPASAWRCSADEGLRRIALQDRFFPLGVGLALEAIGLGVGEQFVEHDAERIHVGHRRHRFAAHLFGRGVVQRERAHAGAGLFRRGEVGVDEFRDAEVEQAHVAAGRDEDVRRLEVAVDDQVRVRVRDRVADLVEQVEPRFQRKAMRAAVIGDRLAFDVFEREIRLMVVAHARVEQARDVRMRQAREDLAFAGEAQAQVRIDQARAQQLQRDAALIQAVGARGQPHLAHAAFAEHAFEAIRADFHAGPRAGQGRDERLGEEVLAIGFELEQFFEVVRGLRILFAHQAQAAFAFVVVELEQRIEQRGQPLPALGVHHVPRQLSFKDASRNRRAFCQSRRMLRSDRLSSAAISSSERPAK